MLKDGIPVNENTLVELKDVCDYLNIEMKDYFGDIETFLVTILNLYHYNFNNKKHFTFLHV